MSKKKKENQTLGYAEVIRKMGDEMTDRIDENEVIGYTKCAGGGCFMRAENLDARHHEMLELGRRAMEANLDAIIDTTSRELWGGTCSAATTKQAVGMAVRLAYAAGLAAANAEKTHIPKGEHPGYPDHLEAWDKAVAEALSKSAERKEKQG